jgi:hypothetical protein
MTARSPLPRACRGCGFGEGTFAGVFGNDEDAPIPDLAGLTPEPRDSTLCEEAARRKPPCRFEDRIIHRDCVWLA